MGGDERDVLILDPLLECDDVFRHVPDSLDGGAAFDVEGVDDVLRLLADGVFIINVVGDVPHVLPVELLGVEAHSVIQVGLVDVEVHHAGIRTADLRDVRLTEAAADLGGFAPVLDLRFDVGVSPFHDTGDDGMSLAGTLEVSDHFADSAAGVEFAEPGRDVGLFIDRRQFLLDVDQNDGDVEVSDCRQHVVGRSIRQELQDDEVDIGGAELVAGCHGLLFGSDDAAVDEFDAVRDVGGFEVLVLGIKFRDQLRELRQVRTERDGEDADFRFGFD